MTIVAEPTVYSPTTDHSRCRSLPASALLSLPLGLPQAALTFGAAPWLHEAQSAIKELRLLENGWDGAVAAQVDLWAIDRASAFSERLAHAIPSLRAPFVSPTVNGGVNLEWEADTTHIDLDFDAAGDPWVYAVDVAGTEYESRLSDVQPEAVAVFYAFRTHAEPAL